MYPSKPYHTLKNTILFPTCVLLAIGFLILIYSSSFNGSWQYDDDVNIVENSMVHLESISWDGFVRALKAAPQCQSCVQRPLAYLSFALNYLWCGLEPWGYHLVNLIIHLVTAALLFAFILKLLQTPRLVSRFGAQSHWIALIGTLWWAAHPIQVTAVTYIVQRMASMAAMFALLSIYLFLRARTAENSYQAKLYFGFSILAYLLGLICKENIILIPLCMVLLEVAAIGGLKAFSRSTTLAVMIFGLVVMGALVYVIVSMGSITLFDPFPNRPYSPVQRMLTQPRVMWLYLSLIVLPMRSRMTLLHDIDFSESWMQPGTTLPALVLLFLSFIVLLLLIRRYPLTSFCFLFFMVNHLVEASFLNLGLVYEHRNYLPSMLVFVPPVAWIVWFVNHRELSRIYRFGCITALIFMILSNGHTVRAYNCTFNSELALWQDVVTKSPNLSVAHNNLGKVLWDMGEFEKANQVYKLAHDLNRFTDFTQKGMIHHNLGLYQTYVLNAYEPALNNFRKALRSMSGNPATWYHVIRCHLLLGQVTQAEEALQNAVVHWPSDPNLGIMMAMIHLVNMRLEEAMRSLEKIELPDLNGKGVHVIVGEVQRHRSNLKLAENAYLNFVIGNPDKVENLLVLIALKPVHCRPEDQYLQKLINLSEGTWYHPVKTGSLSFEPISQQDSDRAIGKIREALMDSRADVRCNR